MILDRGWLHAEAARLGLALSDDDLGAIADIIEKTRTELAATVQPAPGTQDPAMGFLPFDDDRSARATGNG